MVLGNVNEQKELNKKALKLAMTLLMASLLSRFHLLGYVTSAFNLIAASPTVLE